MKNTCPLEQKLEEHASGSHLDNIHSNMRLILERHIRMAKRIFLVWDYTLSRQRYDACLGTDGVPKYAAKIGKGIYRCYAGDEACHKMKKINDEPICSFYNENR